MISISKVFYILPNKDSLRSWVLWCMKMCFFRFLWNLKLLKFILYSLNSTSKKLFWIVKLFLSSPKSTRSEPGWNPFFAPLPLIYCLIGVAIIGLLKQTIYPRRFYKFALINNKRSIKETNRGVETDTACNRLKSRATWHCTDKAYQGVSYSHH